MSREIPPNTVNNFLTWRTLDEDFGLTDDRYFDGIANPFLEVIVAFFSCASNKSRVRTGVDRPTCRKSQGKFQHVRGMVSQSPDSQDFAECASRAGQRGSSEVPVAQEVRAVEEKTENNSQVSLSLQSVVLFF